MSFEFEFPESTDVGGNRLEKIGWYHVMVLSVDEQPTNARGEMIDGFQATFAVVDGENPDQKKKELTQTFFNAKLSSKDGGEFAKKKQARFCLATDIMPKGPHKPGDRVTINLQDAAGRQLVVKTQWQKDMTTKQPTDYAEIAFAEIYHVDDPAVEKVAKSQAHLDLIPKDMRKKSEDFGDGKGSKSGTNGNGKPGGANTGGRSSDAAKAAAADILNGGGGGSGNGAASGGAAASTSVEDL